MRQNLREILKTTAGFLMPVVCLLLGAGIAWANKVELEIRDKASISAVRALEERCAKSEIVDEGQRVQILVISHAIDLLPSQLEKLQSQVSEVQATLRGIRVKLEDK